MNKQSSLSKSCIAVLIISFIGIVFNISSIFMQKDVAAEEITPEEISSAEGLMIPLPVGIDENKIVIENTFDNVVIRIPNVDENFYYDNSLKGNSEGIKYLGYGYNSGEHIFSIEFNECSEVKTVIDNNELSLLIDPISAKYETVIVINPTHGGADTGTISYEVVESYVNLELANTLKNYIASDNIGVFLIRDGDENISLDDRNALAEKLGADIFINISCNANQKTRVKNGFEYVIDSDKGTMHVLNVYAGYLTNKAEAKKLQKKEYLNELSGKISDILIEKTG